MPIPGVPTFERRHDRPSGAERIVAYLGRRLPASPPLARDVCVAVFRTHDARDVLATGETSLRRGLAENKVLCEHLRLALFQQARIGDDFRGDPVLTHVFPPPKQVEPVAQPVLPPAPPPPATALRERAVKLVERLAPTMGTMRDVAAELERPGAAPGTAGLRARAVATRLQADPAAIALLRRALTTFDRLRAELAARGTGGLGIVEACAILGELRVRSRRHPDLMGLWPAETTPTTPAAPPARRQA